MRSIRSYLLTRLLGGTAVVLIGAGAIVYVAMTRSLEAQFGANLADRIQGFASILFQTQDHVEFEFSQELMPEYDRAERPDYFELLFQDGRLLESSPSLDGESLKLEGTPTREPAHWSAALPDGRPGRFVAQIVEVHHVYPEEGPQRPTPAILTIVVAAGREQLVSAQRTMLLECFAVSLVLIALIALLSWRAVEQGLEPAHRLAVALDAIEVERLPQRLEIGELPVELQPIASTTDALIRRVDATLERERRITLDIAHELRTPISEIVTVSEVALRDGPDVEGAGSALRTIRDVAWRMARSVSTLLRLARLEIDAESFDREPVEFGAIVGRVIRTLEPVAAERELCVTDHVDPAERVTGDSEVLQIVISNLLSNAVYHSPRRGTVECRLERLAEGWRFSVANEAPQLTTEDMRVLCEPFWRKDRARMDRDRSGLGLALSRALVAKIGLELRFELENGVFRAILTRRDEPERTDSSAASTQPTANRSSASTPRPGRR